MSFSIKEGQKVAIVGNCGSGKSTILSLIERFYSPETGRITIGDISVSELKLDDYREKLAYVPQLNQVFSDSIREALTYGNPNSLTDSKLLEASVQTGFSDYLNLQEEGFDTLVRNGGNNMSGGQLQAYVDEKYYGKFDEAGNQLTKAYSESYMRSHFVVLNGMFKYAVYPKRIMRENIMQYVKKRKKEKAVSIFGEQKKQKIHTITRSEYETVIQCLMDKPETRLYVLPIQIAYYTGLRAGEVCGLTWDDIDLEEQYLTVRRNMYYDMVEIKGRKHYQVYTLLPDEMDVIGSRVTKGKLIKKKDVTSDTLPIW